MTDAVEIRSVHGGTTLRFVVTGRGDEGISFEVGYSSTAFQGRVSSTTYFTEPPARFFAAVAADWKSEREWADLEGAVKLNASGDSTGHVRLDVELTSHDSDHSMRGHLDLEMGQLDGIAAAMRGAFGFETFEEHTAWSRNR